MYEEASNDEDTWRMKHAVVTLLQLPAKILEYSHFTRSRVRVRSINSRLRRFLDELSSNSSVSPNGSRRSSTADSEDAVTSAVRKSMNFAQEGLLSKAARALNQSALLDPTNHATRKYYLH